MIRIIYQVFTDVWRLARKYEFRRLTDSEWERSVPGSTGAVPERRMQWRRRIR